MRMKKLIPIISALAGLILLAGCVSEGYVATSVTTYEPYPVYMYLYPVYRPYYHRPYCPPVIVLPPHHNPPSVQPPRHDVRPPEQPHHRPPNNDRNSR
jgi:hypothetical protein